jgi:hypothetical protein
MPERTARLPLTITSLQRRFVRQGRSRPSTQACTRSLLGGGGATLAASRLPYHKSSLRNRQFLITPDKGVTVSS